MSRTIGSTSGVRCTNSGVTSASPRARGDKALSKPDVPVPNTNPAVADDFKKSRRVDMVPLLRAKGSDGASIIHSPGTEAPARSRLGGWRKKKYEGNPPLDKTARGGGVIIRL